MKRLSPNQRKFIIEQILKGQKVRECRIAFRKRFGRTVSRDGVQKIMKKWNEKSSIEDLHRGNSGRPRTNRNPDNFQKVSDGLHHNGKRTSIRKVAASTSLPYSSVRDIMVKDMKLYPYKPTISQKLNDRQIENRLAFCRRMKGMIDNFELDVNKIIFSDESHMHLESTWCAKTPEFGPGPSQTSIFRNLSTPSE